jgi:glycosyltransferase involved in cell wall biosynthesis
MKTCLIYDDLVQKGGGEGFFETLINCYPKSDIFVPIASPYYLKKYESKNLHYSKTLSFIANHFKKLGYIVASFLSPYWFESLKLSKYSLCINLSNRFSLSTVTNTNTVSILIVTTPLRKIWNQRTNLFLSFLNPFLRVQNFAYSKRHNHVVVISSYVQKRVKKYWTVESTIVAPPVRSFAKVVVQKPHVNLPNKYFLMGGRFSESKSMAFGEVLDIFLQRQETLVVFGFYSDFIKKKYGSSKNIIFVGPVSDSELKYLYINCLALIHPQVEDFGLTPLEALSFKKRVIAFKKGGVLNYLNSKVALFYTNRKELISSIERSKKFSLDKNEARRIVSLHSFDNFKYNLKKVVAHYVKSSR